MYISDETYWKNKLCWRYGNGSSELGPEQSGSASVTITFPAKLL